MKPLIPNPARIGWILFLSLLAFARWLAPERGMDSLGLHAAWDALFALLLLAGFLFAALGLGLKLFALFRLAGLTSLEKGALALFLGQGVLGLGVTALALLGLFSPIWVGVGLAAAGVVNSAGAWSALGRAWGALRETRAGWGSLGFWGWLGLGFGLLVAAMTGLVALAPPVHYDAIMYHLEALRYFFDAGRFILLPDIWQANLPFAGEMLFAIGLAFGSDIFARLVHFSAGLGLVLLTWIFARRWAGPAGRLGWMALVILLGVWALPLWASDALVDILWAVDLGLAVFGLLRWRETEDKHFLALAGVFAGLVIGVKSLALAGAFALGLWVLAAALRSQDLRGFGLRVRLQAAAWAGLWYGLPAVLFGLPWYLKSWVLAGNPVYPILWGGPGWDALRVDLLSTYLQSFGVGRSLLDFVLLPFNLYTQPGQFSTLKLYEALSPLFPLALLYPWLARRHTHSQGLDRLAGISLLLFIAWALGSQQIRFLLPVFPLWAVLAVWVLQRIEAGLKRPLRFVPLAALVLVAAVSMVLTSVNFFFYAPWRVALGQESKTAFLMRTVDNYPAWNFIQTSLPPGSAVLQMGDGRTYYCPRCLPDGDQSAWTRLALANLGVPEAASALHTMGVTHLLYSLGDARVMAASDPSGRQAAAYQVFEERFRPACTQVLFETPVVQVLEITCK